MSRMASQAAGSSRAASARAVRRSQFGSLGSIVVPESSAAGAVAGPERGGEGEAVDGEAPFARRSAIEGMTNFGWRFEPSRQRAADGVADLGVEVALLDLLEVAVEVGVRDRGHDRDDLVVSRPFAGKARTRGCSIALVDVWKSMRPAG